MTTASTTQRETSRLLISLSASTLGLGISYNLAANRNELQSEKSHRASDWHNSALLRAYA